MFVFYLPEQQLHGPAECLEVDQVVDGSGVLDVAEDGHPDDCIDKSDECQQGPDVEQGGQGHDQGKQQLPDSLRSLKA